MALDDERVTTKTELLTSHLKEQVKQHIVYDNLGRPKFAFTAYIDVKDGEPCMCTEYVYKSAVDGTDIKARQERIYSWKAVWDTGFVFDPAANYDPDGDGDL